LTKKPSYELVRRTDSGKDLGYDSRSDTVTDNTSSNDDKV